MPIALLRGYKGARPSHIKIQKEAKPRYWKTGVSPGDHLSINWMVYALSRILIVVVNLMFEHGGKDTLFMKASGNWDVPTLSERHSPCQFC
jgi:hypothetical protein